MSCLSCAYLGSSAAAHGRRSAASQHVRLQGRSRAVVLSQSLLYVKAQRCVHHDATCSNVIRAGGLDAPFLFIFFTS